MSYCNKTSICQGGHVRPWYEPIDPQSRTAYMCGDCAAHLNAMGSDYREERRKKAIPVARERRRSFIPQWLRRGTAKDLTHAA